MMPTRTVAHRIGYLLQRNATHGWHRCRHVALHDRPPLSNAAWRVQEDIVRELIRQGADINSRDSEGHTALSRAARKEHSTIISLLLDNDTRTDIVPCDGVTTLMQGALSGENY